MALTNPNSVINVEKLSYFKGKLAKTDSAVAGQVVKAVSETGGIISVSRAALNATDIQLVAVASPDTQYAAQYKLVVGKTETTEGAALGATINIPKDQFLKDAKLYVSKAAADEAGKTDYPTTWTKDNFPAIRFEFQLSDSTNPLWVSVKDLVDTYTKGDGIDIDIDNNKISVRLKDGGGLGFDSGGNLEVVADNTLHYTGDAVGVNYGQGLAVETEGSVLKLAVKLDSSTLSKSANGIKVDDGAGLKNNQLATASSENKGGIKVLSRGLVMDGEFLKVNAGYGLGILDSGTKVGITDGGITIGMINTEVFATDADIDEIFNQ